MSFSIPDVVLQRLGPVTISAQVNGVDAARQTFSQPGGATYMTVLPPQGLGAELVAVDFSLDKTLPPTPQDGRELGIIVSTIGLTSK